MPTEVKLYGRTTMPTEVKLYDKPLPVFEGTQDVNQIRQSIVDMAHHIARSDLSSTFVTSQRILSMRTLVDTLEQYNGIIIRREKEKEDADSTK